MSFPHHSPEGSQFPRLDHRRQSTSTQREALAIYSGEGRQEVIRMGGESSGSGRLHNSYHQSHSEEKID